MQRAAASAALASALSSVPTRADMMNGGYLASDPLTGAHVKAAEHRGEFIEVYSEPISTRYSEVYVRPCVARVSSRFVLRVPRS